MPIVPLAFLAYTLKASSLTSASRHSAHALGNAKQRRQARSATHTNPHPRQHELSTWTCTQTTQAARLQALTASTVMSRSTGEYPVPISVSPVPISVSLVPKPPSSQGLGLDRVHGNVAQHGRRAAVVAQHQRRAHHADGAEGHGRAGSPGRHLHSLTCPVSVLKHLISCKPWPCLQLCATNLKGTRGLRHPERHAPHHSAGQTWALHDIPTFCTLQPFLHHKSICSNVTCQICADALSDFAFYLPTVYDLTDPRHVTSTLATSSQEAARHTGAPACGCKGRRCRPQRGS